MTRILESLGDLATMALRRLPPELAHDAGVAALASVAGQRLAQLVSVPQDSRLQVVLPGIGKLQHPVGLAAGFDKDARAIPSLAALGFSYIEVGAVTPRPQPGNPKPRLFRYPGEGSLINRMGFNSAGVDTIQQRLVQLGWDNEACPIGINLGKNKDTPLEEAHRDYLTVQDKLRNLARFFVVNVSSPNTPGLRSLATPAFLKELASGFGDDLRRVWVKFDPDMEKPVFQDLVSAVAQLGYAGLVLCNTHRVERPEPGGLSGRPVLNLANQALTWAWEVHRGSTPMIGVGGIMTGKDVLNKVALGATAVQIYTSFVYSGPWVVARILNEIRESMDQADISSLESMRGSAYSGHVSK
ncbi:MAG: hypothetical protein RIQ81_2632 [Pseudomonadota bacterium]